MTLAGLCPQHLKQHLVATGQPNEGFCAWMLLEFYSVLCAANQKGAHKPWSPAEDVGGLKAREAGQKGGVTGAGPRLKAGTLGVSAPERGRAGVES